MIYGARVQQARELAGLTQVELAEQMQIGQPVVARIEGDQYGSADRLLASIAFVTGLPPAFFRQPPSEFFPTGSLQFRSRSGATKKERQQAYSYARTAFEVAERLMARLEVAPVRLGPLDAEPTEAARIVRSTLRFAPDVPVPDLLGVLERAGVIVFLLPVASPNHLGFSGWAGTRPPHPVICVSRALLGDRLRWTVAHELGELVLPLRNTGSERERVVNAFAAEFLLPEEAMRREILAPYTIYAAAKMKPRWGVAMQALIKRAWELEIITQRQYQYLMAQISARGWRLREPENLDIPMERPRAMRYMAELLYGRPIDVRRMAEDHNLTVPFVRGIWETAQTPRDNDEDIAVQPLRTRPGGRVLLVEDDPAVGQMYKTRFELDGHEVDLINDGPEAIEKAKGNPPDVLLLDLHLPTMNGLEVLEALRQDERTRNVAVVILSNYSERDLVDRALRLGALEYLVKSRSSPARLAAVVRTLTGSGSTRSKGDEQPEAASNH